MNRALTDEPERDPSRRPIAPRYSPMWQLVMARLREFLREPEAVFWVYGFPIVMVVALGIAFRNKPVETITVDIVDNGTAATWAASTLAADERFATNRARVRHRDELRPLILERSRQWQKTALLKACEDNGVPAGPINSIAETFDDPQVKARGLRLDLADRDGNAIPTVRMPVVFSQTPLAYERPSPRLGEHTDEILAELESLEAKRKSA